MLRQQREVEQRLQMLVDAGLFALSFYLAHLLRSHWRLALFGGAPEIGPFSEYSWLIFVVLPMALVILNALGFYDRSLLAPRAQTMWMLAKTSFYMLAGLVLLLWVSRQTQEFARSVLLFFWLISFVVLSLKEELLLRWRRSRLGSHQLRRRFILVGTPEEAEAVVRQLQNDGAEVVDVAARLNLHQQPIQKLVELMHEHSPNGVLLAAEHAYFSQIEEVIAVCEREGVDVWLLADFFKTQISKTSVALFAGRPMLVFRTAPSSAWPLLAKKCLDFCGALFLLILSALPMLAAAALIKLTSRGPVLFKQKRSGLNGREFTMLKFRSMTSDAEQRKHELEALNEMSGPVFKVTNDPRITRFGRFMRKWSIDELPQLLNVLAGEMSLVGPRPLPVHEVQRFDDPAHRRRLSVKPGLTCLWQISGRNNVKDFREWVRLDLEYIDNWSIWLDMQILFRTVPAVLSGSGAK